jgi:putative hydrolase of the HAD superfamily
MTAGNDAKWSDMNKPKLIIFDLGRVLIDFDFRKVIRNLKRYTSLSEKQIRQYFMQTPLWDSFERGNVEPNDFFLRLTKDLHLQKLTFKQFAPFWNAIFTEKHDTVSILQRLRGRYRIALLSNVNILHWDHVREAHDFIEWFDHPIASCLVGQRKPDFDIFRTTLHQAGAKPEEAVFIDDVESHILAARSLGIRAHQFIDARQLVKDLDGIL